MNTPQHFNTLSPENKKIILYKIAEIYGGDDELLEFIDSLEGDNVDTICNIVFAENPEERQKIRDNELKSLGETLEKIESLKNSIDKLTLEIAEFSEKIEEDEDIQNIEDILENIN